MKGKFLGMAGIIAAGLLCFAGCADTLPNSLLFTEFPQYEEFDEDVSSIEVSWDLGDSTPLTFAIEDTETVGAIVSMLKEIEFQKGGSEMQDGGNHSSLTFVYAEGVKVTVPLSEIEYGNDRQYYSYPDSDLYEYIKQIGEALGYID